MKYMSEKKINWLKNYYRQCNIEYLELLATELEWMAWEIIDDFYADYDPIYYKRNYGLYDAIHITRRYSFSEPSILFSIRSAYMEDWYRDPTEYIFVGAIIMGKHGTAKVKISLPAPMKRIIDYINLYNDKDIKSKAIESAKKIVGSCPF